MTASGQCTHLAAAEDLSVGADPMPEVVRWDPIFRLVGFGFRRWTVFAVVMVATGILLANPELRFSDQPKASELQRLGRIAWALVGVPVGLYLYLWVPVAVSSLIPELETNGVLDDPEGGEGTVEDSVARIDRWMGSPLWPAPGLLAIVGSFAFGWVKLAPPADTTGLAVTNLAYVGIALAIYLGSVMLLRLVVGTVATSWAINRAESRVIPLHGDEAGGWGGFGRRFFVLARGGIAYGAVAILINLAAIQANLDPTRSAASMVTLAFFLLIPPLVVWGWFFAPHRAMLDARARVLTQLSDAAERAASAGLASGESNDPAELATASERLEALIHRRDLIVATHPAWPLRLVELRVVWATAFAPIVTAVVATIAGIVTGWLDGLV
jgi:hypothetical protein